MEDKTNVGFGFSFSKKKESKVLKNDLTAVVKGEADDRDFLNAVEGKELKSLKPKEEVEELVIPLIGVNRWRQQGSEKKPADKQASGDNGTLPATGDTLTDEAVKELIQEAKTGVEQGSGGDLVIPLWMQNKVPEGFEGDDKFDVSIRPAEPTDEDYEKIPVDKFGLALLRGMGWKPGEGIGRNKQVIKPVETALRPKGLGLGAERQTADAAGGEVKVKGDQQQLVMKKGTHCLLTASSHKGQYGVIEGCDEDTARCYVRLAIGDEVVAISQRTVNLVTKEEYQRNSKIINKDKYDKYAAAQEMSAQSHESNGRKSDGDRHKHRSKDHSSHHHHRHRDEDSDRDSGSRHRHGNSNSDGRRSADDSRLSDASDSRSSKKHRVIDDDDYDQHSSSKRSRSDTRESASALTVSWLRPQLRVRIIDDKYCNGKYYKQKVVIEDVLGGDLCVCQCEDGRILDDVRASRLETVIPRSDNSYVIIIRGKHVGQLGKVLARNKSSSTASIQLLSDRDLLLQLSYDDICEYVGDVTAEQDY